MSSPESATGRISLNQLQFDAPQSPVVGFLRNRLKDSAESVTGRVILNQLQFDAPQSPLVGFLRNRLKDDDEIGSQIANQTKRISPESSYAVGDAALSPDRLCSEEEDTSLCPDVVWRVEEASTNSLRQTEDESPSPESLCRAEVTSLSPEDLRPGPEASSSSGYLYRDEGTSQGFYSGNGDAGFGSLRVTETALGSSDVLRVDADDPASDSSFSTSLNSRSVHLDSHLKEDYANVGNAVIEQTVDNSVPQSFVVVHNVTKRHNLGTLARSATAFGVSELILVGRKDFNAFGSHGASLHIQFRHFHTLLDAACYLKAKDADICGVEIVEGAIAVHKQPFSRSTAFLVGNEGTGLSKKEMEICSFFVYIPQCGSGTASLNVTVAASIVLHHFAVWAGFSERQREGQKFVVAERPVRRTPRNSCAESREVVAERRRLKTDCGPDDWLLCDAVEEIEDDDFSAGRDIAALEFPNCRKSGLLSSLNSLFE